MARLKMMLGVIGALVWLAVGVSAQGNVDPKVSVGELETQAASQTQEELDASAKKWFEAVKAKEKELAAVAIKKKDAEGDDKTSLTDQIEKLREERTELVNRFEVVLDALDAKGGDTVSYRAYVKALPGYVDFKDPSAVWKWLVNWLKSPNGGVKWGINILAFFAILFGFKIISSVAAKVVKRALVASKLDVSDLLRDFFVNAVRKIIFIIGLVMALGQIGIDVGPLLAGIGVVGFILGFALQGTLSNFAAGIMILMYRPFDIGNVIEAAGATGKVSEMSLVSTTLLSPDNQIIVIPNSKIWGGVITNITGNDTRRVDMIFGIGYDDDVEKAQQILEDIVKEHELVLADPAPVIRLHELADSSVNFVARPWSKTSDYWKVKWDVTEAVKKRFDAEGISIPFPQQDVHVHQVSGDSAS